MGTLQYCSLIRSSLCLLLLFVNFPVNVQSLKESRNTGRRHFHTLQISSLLPASVCSPSAAAGFNKRQSILEVVHRHGPCSKSSATAAPPLAEILSSDQSRVESIQARLRHDPSTDKLNSHKIPNKNYKLNGASADLPAQPGKSYGTGDYIVTIGLGTPEQTLSLIFDTGSDLTWTQCQPCVGSCYEQNEPIFNPFESSSYSNISCNSEQCGQVLNATGNNPLCLNTTCAYGIRYGDQSFSNGFLGKDKFTLTPNDVFPDFVFGCGQQNEGLFGHAAGIIGLGRDDLSMVSQTAQKYGKYFSYCLPSISSSTGHLTFGENNGIRSSNNVKFTPFADARGKSYYFVDIISISVAGNQLPIDRSVFETTGTIIDSGTVITRLQTEAYREMSSAFQELMKEYPRASRTDILFDTCYDFRNYTSVMIPTISFTFKGDVNVELDVSGILVAVGSKVACLAFAGNGGAGDSGIFGNTQQKTFEVVYDVAGGKLGFGAGRCN